MKETIREALEVFKNKYEILSCGSCDNYCKDGFQAELKAKFPIIMTNDEIKWRSAQILINKPHVYVRKGFINDIVQALNFIR